MKLKNIKLLSVAGAMSLCCVSFLTSCDGGSSSGGTTSDVTDEGQIDLPDNPDGANDVNEGLDADSSGANSGLEASYGVQIFEGINTERTNRGFSELTRDSQMDDLAAAHNLTMINQAVPFGTIETGHDNFESRAQANAARGFNFFGENTAGIRGFSSSVVVSTFIDGWVDSPGHFENIVGDFTHTGVAVTVDSRDGTIYATQIFAK